MSRAVRPAILLIVVLGAVVVLGSLWLMQQRFKNDSVEAPREVSGGSESASDPSLPLGLRVFAEQCAPCHGTTGRGDGPAAYLLFPKARDFSSGQFRLTSTQSGLPSDADLLRTLTRGIPGSSMPPWGHLPDSVLSGLVSVIRELAIEGRTNTLTESGAMGREQASAVAHDVFAPGAPTEVPPRPNQGVDLALGRELYATGCAPCHDLDGRGLKKLDLKDDDGFPIFARDFTQGVFKGGSEPDVLALRITRGLPGSPMPGLPYSAGELWSIVDYLGTLIKPGAQERAEQSEKVLRPAATDRPIPRDPADERWMKTEATFLALTPLWWRNDRIEGVKVSVMRDSAEIAFRLEWNDSTSDIQQQSQGGFSDGIAIQFSNAIDPPSLTMGMSGSECDIWYWRASIDPLIAETEEQSKAFRPNVLDDLQLSQVVASDPAFLTATAVGNPIAATEVIHPFQNLQAAGFGTLGPDGPEDQIIDGAAQRTLSGWSAVFVRRLKPSRQGDVEFSAGNPMHVGFAVWDGHHQDRNGQKSVSIWHRIDCESLE